MADRLTIGEFSRITHLSIRMLRRYHEQKLLVPAEVDPDSGYRYYSPTQIRPALTIRRFRDLDLPLVDLRRFLAAESAERPDFGTARQVVAAHLRRLEDRLGRTQRAVEALRELLDPEAERAVALEELPARRVLAVSIDVPEGAGLDWYDEAMRDLDAAAGERSVLPLAVGTSTPCSPTAMAAPPSTFRSTLHCHRNCRARCASCICRGVRPRSPPTREGTTTST